MLVWIAVIAWFVVVGGGLLFVGLRARRTMRTARAMRRRIDERVVAIQATVDEVSARAEGMGGEQARLQESLARLQRSLAELRILVSAAQEARSGVDRVRRYVQP